MNKVRNKIMVIVSIFCLWMTACAQGPVIGQDSQGSQDTESMQESSSMPDSMEPDASTDGSETETTAETEATEEPELPDLHEYDFTLCFGGDMSLDEAAVTTKNLDASDKGIYGCISPELIKIMQDADVTCINNEFTYSTNGEPLKGKKYTFRAKPERVAVLQELGVDVAQLANNHVYDYGKVAMLDTFATLEGAGIRYFGAGKNLKEAMQPLYFELDGKKVALVAASRAEKYKMTPQATETNPGILRCYNTKLFLEVIKEADANADFVIAVVHWGTEYSTKLESVQLTTGKEYLDAGADVIIGGHSHCLQGMEYYKGKPIFYSLGNFWFNKKNLDTMLVKLHFSGNDEAGALEASIIPAIQNQGLTTYVDGDEAQRIFTHLEKISVNIEIDENGVVKEKNKN